MSHHRRAPLLLVSSLVVAVAACSGGGASSPPSGDPSAAPSASPAGEGTVGHPTGASDVILRYDEGGGFVMPSWAASMAPHFTLYGDGTAVLRDPTIETPPSQGSVFVMNPMHIAKLSEEQIQELLVFALGEGGLAAARPTYDNQMIADASTAIFTIDTGDIQKQVSVYALGLDDPSGTDAPARAAFKRLADRLVGLGSGGAVSTTEYVPEAYRVTLLDAAGVVAPDVRAWPWKDVAIADFQPSPDPNGPQFPHLTMTAAQLDQLDITGYEGGFQNLVITAPDGGQTYTLSARPILPGEPE